MKHWSAAGTFFISSILASQALANPPPWAKNQVQTKQAHNHKAYTRQHKKPTVVVKQVHVTPVRYGTGWHHYAQAGQTLPRDLHLYRYRLPAHARIRHPGNGITELVIAEQVIRIVDATHTIISVSR